MSQAPKVGFVSLGCPKALVDSERILTQLRTDGYEISPDYSGADVVVVNTCGFIDSAKAESLEAIGEALEANGRVIVTGCMGKNASDITKVHPKVLAVTGPQQYEDVVGAIHKHAPMPNDYDPFTSLVPARRSGSKNKIGDGIGIKLTPRHYAYLKISEGCNHKCSFCIIPSMRGKLVSRPIGQVLAEARRLVNAGVRELLVISQDTSAYGVDLKYKEDSWGGQLVKTRMKELCEGLGSMGAWVRLHYVYPYPHVDEIIP
ncbi:MAG TPA: radical SAM protein, partial [Xanthomonadales bacterium]|nr:radical SAM protein [Xanthomonadales bacterium]